MRERDGMIFDVEAVWDGGSYVLGGDGKMDMGDLKRIQEKIKPKVGMVGGNNDDEVFIISPRMINTLANEMGIEDDKHERQASGKGGGRK